MKWHECVVAPEKGETYIHEAARSDRSAIYMAESYEAIEETINFCPWCGWRLAGKNLAENE